MESHSFSPRKIVGWYKDTVETKLQGTKGGRKRKESKGEGGEERRKILRVSPPEIGGPRNRLRGRSAIRPTVSCVCQTRRRDARSSPRLSLFHPSVDQPVRPYRARGSIVASLLLTDQSAIGVYLIRQCQCRVVSHFALLDLDDEKQIR